MSVSVCNVTVEMWAACAVSMTGSVSLHDFLVEIHIHTHTHIQSVEGLLHYCALTSYEADNTGMLKIVRGTFQQVTSDNVRLLIRR